MRIFASLALGLGLLLAALPARGSGPPAAAGPQVEEASPEMVFEFFPTHLPVTVGSPFATLGAGSGTWPLQSGPFADPTICRECTFTSIVDLAQLSCTTGCIDDHIALKKWLPAPAQVPAALGGFTGGLFSFGTNTGSGASEGLSHLVSRAVTDHALGVLAEKESWLGSLDDFLTGVNGVCELLGGWLNAYGVPNSDFECSIVPAKSETWLVAYRPNQWRFLAAEYPAPVGPSPPIAQPNYYHPYPFALFEARQRGGRSFCAMREAAFAQHASGKWTMGSEALGSGAFGLFTAGESQVELLVAQPTKLTTSTSANAFSIPMAVRSRISPFHGPILPTMPAKSTPVVWVTGDAEVVSFEDLGPVVTGHDEQGQPVFEARLRKAYLNGQHVDLFAGRQDTDARLALAAKVPLWGPVFAQIDIGMEFDTGQLVKGFSGQGSTQDWSVAGDGRVLVLPDIPTGKEMVIFPAPRSPRVDDPVSPASTRPWTTPAGGFIATDAPWDPFAAGPYGFVPVELDGPIFGDNLIPGGFGVRTRAAMNDDRSLVIMDRTKEHFALGVGIGFSFGPLKLEIVGETTADGEARQFVTLREHASGVAPAKLLPHPATNAIDKLGPQTNFVVLPELRSGLSAQALKLDANFEIDIDLGLFPFHKEWTSNFLTLGGNDHDIASLLFPEHRRLRVGEYSDFGFEFDELLPDPSLTFRSVYSHLADPGQLDPESFASFPPPAGGDTSSQDVGRCLEDPKVPPPPPPPPPGIRGKKPFATCVWGLPGEGDDIDIWQLPANICSGPPAYPQIGSFVAGALAGAAKTRPFLQPVTSDKNQCMVQILRFLCDAPANERKIQPWGPFQNVVSRRIEMLPPGAPPTADQKLLGQHLQACFAAFVTGPAAMKDQQGDFVASFVVPRFHACFSDGTLQGEWAPE